jgi:hypothetical protein
MSESLDIGAKLPWPDLVWLDSAPVRLLSAALNHYMISHGRQQDKVAPVPASSGPGEFKLSWPDLAGLTWIGTSENTTKHDDAVAPVKLWDSRVLTVDHNPEALQQFQDLRGYTALDCLRQFLLRAWHRNVCKSLCSYLQGMYGPSWFSQPKALRDRMVGRNCLWRATEASWWEWRVGSTIFFWPWPKEARILVRDGHPPWFWTPPPYYTRPQRLDPEPATAKKISAKLTNIIQKGKSGKGQFVV